MATDKNTDKNTPGLRQRHGNRCKGGEKCGCPWEAFVYSKRDGKKIRKSFPDRASAKSWRDDAGYQVRKKLLRAPKPTTIAEAAKAWLDGARTGEILTRSGDRYKPSAIRSYEAALRLRVEPELGGERLCDLACTDLQRFVNRLQARGLNASTVSGTVLPLRAIYRHAVKVGDATINPTSGLDLPKVRSAERRFAAPAEADRLLAIVPAADRALWATGFYAGLRRGELQALRVENVDLAKGVIHVHHGWDPIEGEIDTKNRKRRDVPIPAVLRDYLDEHVIGLAWREQPDGLVFGTAPRKPFTPSTNEQRAKRAWKAAKLEKIDMHETRHSYASMMIAAGVNAKALSIYMGHANISITLDLYGHLFPGNEDEAAALLDAFLERADTQARLAQIEPVEQETGANTGASMAQAAF
jgi:integrase